MCKLFATLTLPAVTLLLLTPASVDAQQSTKRKPPSMQLFLKPFKPQTVTPQFFGLLPENEYLQKEIELTPEQKQRMREIELQLTRVPSLLIEPDVRKVLDVTDSQFRELAKRRSETVKQFDKLAAEWRKLTETKKKKEERPTRDDRADYDKRAEEIEAGFDEAVLKVLTHVQRGKLEKLRGKPVDPAKIFNRLTMAYPTPWFPEDLYSKPYEPPLLTPKVFGFLPHIKHLQEEMNITAAQKRRMREIEIQLTLDSRIITQADVRKELSLSDKQIQRIERLRKEAFNEKLEVDIGLEKLRRERKARGEKPPIAELRAILKRRAERREELHESVMDVLTKTQHEKLVRLKGKPVDPDRIFVRPGTQKSRPDL
jgi:hypothetical protein